MRVSPFKVTSASSLPATAAARPVLDHVIANFCGDKNGPTLVVIGSLHGNETAGATALERVATKLSEIDDAINGRVFLLRGNTRALQKGVRYIDSDLNRHWTDKHLAERGSGLIFPVSEDLELRELDSILDHILVTARDEVYVLDLHSTSADGMPFATVGDTLRNRRFAQKFPVPILLGIEEQLDGTLLEYLNNAGAVTIGFEGGQHQSDRTVERHEAMTWLALTNALIIDPERVPDLDLHRRSLAYGHADPLLFEVLVRHPVTPEERFAMEPGFNNFDTIRRGQILGKDRNGRVVAETGGLLLMPLYQRLGEDGYFIGQPVHGFWLWLSGVLRRLGVQNIVHLLPGVSRDARTPETLQIDTRVARFFPLQIFHLLGFRRRRWAGNKLVVTRRRHDTTSPFSREC